jgi:hypothetical protein
MKVKIKAKMRVARGTQPPLPGPPAGNSEPVGREIEDGGKDGRV